MPAGQPARSFDLIAQQWCDLAERRHAYYRDLFESGRWKHYFDEQEFITRLRDVIAACERWNALARESAQTEASEAARLPPAA